MRTISSGLTYQAGASRVNNFVSSVPKRLSSSCRARWVSEFLPSWRTNRRGPGIFFGSCCQESDRRPTHFAALTRHQRFGGIASGQSGSTAVPSLSPFHRRVHDSFYPGRCGRLPSPKEMKHPMLVLSRKLGERILIPQFELTFSMVAIDGNTAKLGITARRCMSVFTVRSSGARSVWSTARIWLLLARTP